jgi:hypothetical protein
MFKCLVYKLHKSSPLLSTLFLLQPLWATHTPVGLSLPCGPCTCFWQRISFTSFSIVCCVTSSGAHISSLLRNVMPPCQSMGKLLMQLLQRLPRHERFRHMGPLDQPLLHVMIARRPATLENVFRDMKLNKFRRQGRSHRYNAMGTLKMGHVEDGMNH